MEPIRSKARPRLAASSLRMEIQAKLASTTPCTPEFLDLAIAWADRHVSVLDRINEFDTSGECSSTTESVVVTAWLIARDGTNELIRERGHWMRNDFIKAFAGNDELLQGGYCSCTKTSVMAISGFFFTPSCAVHTPLRTVSESPFMHSPRFTRSLYLQFSAAPSCPQ